MALAGWLSVCAASLCVPCLARDAAQPEAKVPEARVEAVQPDRPDGLVRSIIADLSSDDVMTRIDAERRLTEGASIRLRDMEQAARTMTLTPEQRKRLTSAAYVRFCLEPRAGMGIQSSGDFAERGLVLHLVVPGFPAAEVLRAGDRVLSVDGRPINDIMMMRPVVISRDPGDEVPVVLVRAGATLNVKVRLGRATDLNSRDLRITSEMLDEAWVFRSESFAEPSGARPTAIESGLPNPEAWQYAGTPDVTMDFNDGGDPNLDSRFKLDARRLQNPDLRDLGLTAAGEPRGAGSQIRWAQGGAPGVRMAPNARMAPGAADAARRAQELARLMEERGQLLVRIDSLQREIAGANQERRTQIDRALSRWQTRIKEIDAQLQGRILNP